MMIPGSESGETEPSDVKAHRVARLLRHEVGDLLQSVYSSVAILTERLPGDLAAERRLLSDLKARAELCKMELDAVVEMMSVPTPVLSPMDPAGLVGTAVFQVRRRFPSLAVKLQAGANVPLITGDPRGLPFAFGFLLVAVCQGAKAEVNVELIPTGEAVECRIERDGFAPGNEVAWLQQPFATTQQALLGLALALFKRVVEPHGSVSLTSRSPAGVNLRLSFPVKEP